MTPQEMEKRLNDLAAENEALRVRTAHLPGPRQTEEAERQRQLALPEDSPERSSRVGPVKIYPGITDDILKSPTVIRDDLVEISYGHDGSYVERGSSEAFLRLAHHGAIEGRTVRSSRVRKYEYILGD